MRRVRQANHLPGKPRLTLAVTAALAASVMFTQPAAAAATPSNVTVQFVAAHSGKCFDVESGSTADVTPIIQYTCIQRHPAQTFELRPVGEVDGLTYYQLVARHSGKCLDVFHADLADGTRIIQFTCVNSTAQQFRLEPLASGHSRIVARHSQKCLQPSGGSAADLAPIVQSTCLSTTAQRWRLSSVA